MPEFGRDTAGRLLCHALIACLALGAWSVLAQEPSLAPPAPALAPAETPVSPDVPSLPEVRVEENRSDTTTPGSSPFDPPDFSEIFNNLPPDIPNINDGNPRVRYADEVCNRGYILRSHHLLGRHHRCTGES